MGTVEDSVVGDAIVVGSGGIIEFGMTTTGRLVCWLLVGTGDGLMVVTIVVPVVCSEDDDPKVPTAKLIDGATTLVLLVPSRSVTNVVEIIVDSTVTVDMGLFWTWTVVNTVTTSISLYMTL